MPERNFDSMTIFYVIFYDYAPGYVFYLFVSFLFPSDFKSMLTYDEIGLF